MASLSSGRHDRGFIGKRKLTEIFGVSIFYDKSAFKSGFFSHEQTTIGFMLQNGNKDI